MGMRFVTGEKSWTCSDSGRSDSQTPAFTKPKKDALFLIRMVLGIADDRESKLLEKIENVNIRTQRARL
jgi:hypothetical protein